MATVLCRDAERYRLINFHADTAARFGTQKEQYPTELVIVLRAPFDHKKHGTLNLRWVTLAGGIPADWWIPLTSTPINHSVSTAGKHTNDAFFSLS